MTLEVTLAQQFAEIRDQGQRPTCVAFAASDLHTFVRSDHQPLSVEYAYYFAVQRSPTPDPRSGVTIDAIRTAIERDGQPVEHDWPYLPALPTDLMKWKPPDSVRTVFRRSSTAKISAPPSDIADLIKQGRAPLLGIAITASFFMPNPSGVVSEMPIEPAVGTHAVLGIGLGQSHGEQFILVRNSWGVSWGMKGTAWLSTEYLQRRLIVVMLMEQP
jgi:hypothetical protein